LERRAVQDALKGPIAVERTTEEGDQDAELVARARRDRRAFAALYDRYLEAIYRYCYVRLGRRESAEDATSLVFTKAMDGLPGFRGGTFRSWLFAIAHNTVADAHRTARQMETLDAAVSIADPAPEPDELALRGETGRAVQRALQGLSPDQRDVVELRLAGLTGPEIASALGKSHAAIRITQFRAFARLRTLLEQTAEENIDDA
jgi:RNA polymerase sigma-70 factor (ECF subfamily)